MNTADSTGKLDDSDSTDREMAAVTVEAAAKSGSLLPQLCSSTSSDGRSDSDDEPKVLSSQSD